MDEVVADVSSVMVLILFLACWEVDLAASRAFDVVVDIVGESAEDDGVWAG